MEDCCAAEDSPGRRAAANWFIDGLQEIVTGLEFAISGGMAAWLLHQPFRSERLLSGGLLLLLIILVNGGDRSLIEFFKARMTYPRTGYVKPPMHAEELKLSEPIVSLARPPNENVTDFRRRTVAVLFAGWILLGAINHPWGLPVAMFVTALALYLLNRHSERPYCWWYALFLPAAGLLWMSLDTGQGAGDLASQFRVFVIAGLWLSAQGGWTLYGYLRRNPVPPAKEELHA